MAVIVKQSIVKQTSIRRPLTRRRQAGVSLVEVMVAMLVTMVGLLGFAGLQSRAMVAAEDTYVRTEAMAIAQEFLERKRINGSTELFLGTATTDPAIATYTNTTNWTSTFTVPQCELATSNCTPAQMALYDIDRMRAMLASNAYLPQGQMRVLQSGANGMVRVFVAWGGEDLQACIDNNGMSSGLSRRNCILLEGI